MLTASSHPPHRLVVIGLGLDGPQGLTPNAQDHLNAATVIAGFPSHLQHFQHHPARQIPLNQPLENWIQILRQALQRSSVVLLASGDPLLFGIGRTLKDHFSSDQLIFYPHLSSIQLAFNRAQLPWQNASLISIHGRSIEALETALKRSETPIAVLTDPIHTPAAIAQMIQDLKLPCRYQLWICSQLGSAYEQVICLSPSQVLDQEFPQPNVVILERINSDLDPAADPWPLMGIPDDQFHTFPDHPGLITKQEVRALTLSLLQIPTQGIVWDIGAGTGSLSIELARLAPQLQIYAIEKTLAGIQLIQKNCQRFQVKSVHPISGQAPQSLNQLPAPDRVILGGGGAQIPAIIDQIHQVTHSNGILVGNFATLESCLTAQSELKQRGWIVQLLQVNLARSVAIASATRLSPLNPVLLLQARSS